LRPGAQIPSFKMKYFACPSVLLYERHSQEHLHKRLASATFAVEKGS
jgi:hypothetical protein